MSLTSACFALAIATHLPVELNRPETATQEKKPLDAANIVDVAMFKNGYAVVTREFDIDPSGTTQLSYIPQSSIGTLWFSTSKGATLVRVTKKEATRDEKMVAANLDQILAFNVGKRLILHYVQGTVGHPSVEGILRGVGDSLILETSSGIVAISKSGLAKITASDGKLIYETTHRTNRPIVEFVTTGTGRITMLSLERGISWAPGYAVELTTDKELTLVAKATITNDLDTLNKIDVKLITGFPNLPWAGVIEPFLAAAPMEPRMSGGFGFGGGGGFAAGAPAAMMTQNRAAKEMVAADFSESMAAVQGSGGEQKEDLFFYKYPNVQLKQGERGYYILSNLKSEYKTLFTTQIPDSVDANSNYRGIPDGPADVWNTLQFKNTSNQPLTTGIATAFNKGDIVGQGMLSYTPANANAEIEINKSLDIRVEATEEETARERGAIKHPNTDSPMYDLVTIKGTVEIRNEKSRKVEMRIRKDYTGEVTQAGSAKVTKTAKGLKAVNPSGTLTWTPSLEPGTSLKMEYVYQLYIRSS
jgi:hypothetical protein